jgi:hypothetical protein
MTWTKAQQQMAFCKWIMALALASVFVVFQRAPNVMAQEPAPPAQDLEKAFPKKPPYSPYADRHFPERVYWGDTHLHTSFSMDAGAFGCRLPPRDAYRFAKGYEITASSGQPARLARPLDWFFPVLFSGDRKITALRSAPSTTCASWKFPRRVGPPTMRNISESRCLSKSRWKARSVLILRLPGTPRLSDRKLS